MTAPRGRFAAGDGPWMIAAAILCGGLSLPLLRYHFTTDQGIYAAIADTLLRGGVAYRDAWEFRPPGIFVVYGAAFGLLGRSETSVYVLEVFGWAAAGAALVRLASVRFGSRGAGFAAAVVLPLLYVPLGHARTAQCESFQAPLLLWALAVWPVPGRPAPVVRSCFWAGVLAGAVAWLKTPGALFGALLAVDRLLLDRRAPTWKERLRPAAAMVAGAALWPLATVAYYGARGALPELVDAVFLYAASYVGVGPGMSAAQHVYALADLEPFSAPLVMAAFLGVARAWAVHPGDALRLLVAGATAFGLIVLQGRYFPQHGILLLPFVALGIGLAAAAQGPSPGAAPRARVATAVVGLVGVLFAIAVVVPHAVRSAGRWPSRPEGAVDEDCRRIQYSHAEAKALAEAIRERTSPQDRVFIWGTESLAYFLSDRRMAGPYCHLGMMIGYGRPTERPGRLVERLSREAPRLVVTGGAGPPFQNFDADALLERHPVVKAFIEGAYVPSDRSGPYRIWVRKT